MLYPEGNSPGANVNGYVKNNSLLTSGRTRVAPANIGSTSASFGNGIKTFVNYGWGHYEPAIDKPVPALPNKLVRVPRNTNVMNLGSAHSAADDVDDGDSDDEEPAEAAASDHEATPESYNDAARNERWVQSMKNEVAALRNRGVWRVVPTPQGVGLIKSKYVYRV